MIVTKHARARWSERFDGLDIFKEFEGARYKVGQKLRKRIRRACPGHLIYLSRNFNGRYLAKTKDGIIFVMGANDLIITVLDFRVKS